MTSALMSIGVKALAANYAALQTTGHNIANANVEGYSRQRAELATSTGQFTGAGFFGRGVDVVSVTRSHNEFLTRQAAAAKSLSAADQTRLDNLQRLETLFPTGQAGLGAAASSFFNSMVDLADRPADGSTRQVVLARAADLAARFQVAGEGLDSLQQGVRSDLEASVAEVNDLATSIARANQRIAELKGLGQPANDLLDERERLISRLSEHLDVTRIDASDGTLSVFVAGGQSLVLGNTTTRLLTMADPLDPSRVTLGLADGNLQRSLDENALGGGDIAGLMRFQNEDLADARNRLGQMAVAIGSAVNAQQALGLTLQSPLGSVAGSALFGIGAPQVLAHASNGAPASSVSLVISDASAVKASEYDLQPDPAVAGSYLLTRRSDGLVRSIGSGAVVDGMTITVGAPAPQPGDRFLLQPVSRAAIGFTQLLDDPLDLAAAQPQIALAAATNLGTARAAQLSMTTAPVPVPGATTTIRFTDDLGNYAWELRDSANTLLNSGTGSWQAGGTIPTPPTAINGFSLRIDGVPRNGDVLTVEPTPTNALRSQNGNAIALLALRDAVLVDGRTATDAYAETMSAVGVRVQGARTSADISAAVAAQTEQARSAESGVNMDEEAAHLIQYQQSYQAAAKLLQVAQSIFDTLLQTANR